MLRALFVIVIIIYGLVQSFKSPFNALLFYLWLAYFRPEYWLWSDFVTQLNLSFIVGVFVLIATVMSKKGLRIGGAAALMLVFLAQTFISTMLSPAFGWSWLYWQDFAKSTIISVLIVTLVDDEKKFRLVFSVIAFSLGLEAVKQGWAQMVLNPGAVNQNENAVLGDNNGVAVGMFMLVAILTALARTAATRKEKLIEQWAVIGVVYRGISTFSRGGFLAAAALGVHTLLRSRRKIVSAIGIAVVCAVIVPVMTDEYWERMGTIRSATEDVEAANDTGEGRIHFWRVAVAMANARPLVGVGHNAYTPMYNAYDFSDGEYGLGRAVHSSWFAVLAETGYPGFLLFLSIIATAFITCRRARRLAKKNTDPEVQRLDHYAVAVESSIVVFMVGGSFVAFQYVELLWHTLALSMAISHLIAARHQTVTRAKAVQRLHPMHLGIAVAARPAQV